uniref:Muscarinic acetylcholine receptor n=1 Tax=Cynoglossus semilaevis TaxID=244447 RepID=A0A3P8UPA5_CYNSE
MSLSSLLVHWSNVSGVLTQEANVTDSAGNNTLVVIIVVLSGSLSLVTVVGNILVLVSFRINKALQTVNNYYLLSLAFADLTIGTLSMNFYTTYIVMDQWTLGPVVCDLWLAIDYVASNASVMNLLVISFDRFFSVTRPLTYRVKRTTKRAMTMIGLAWSVSFILWAPAILFWQLIVGERTVQTHECYIQFLSEPIITFCTAIAAFYLPVTIMAVLFWKIYQETEKRAKDVQGLRGSGSEPRPDQKKKNRILCFQVPSSSSRPNTTTTGQNQCHGSNNHRLSEDGEGPKGLVFLQVGQNKILEQFCKTSQTKKISDFKNKNKLPSSSIKSQTDSSSSPPDQSPATITLKNAALAKRFACRARTEINKRRNEKKANDRKAARTLSAILLAFVSTWLPYNIMVLVNTFCQDCIPPTLWALGYWLCYVNSAINPICYALCNKTFRTTFRDLLMCQWRKEKQTRVQVLRLLHP